MMTPEQIQALHETNDFLAVSMARMRAYQSRVTQMLASAKQEHDHAGSDQEKLEAMLSLARIPYALLPYTEKAVGDIDEGEFAGRVDVAISTSFDSTGGEMEYINIEFQFDQGKLVGLRTLLGDPV